MSSSTPSSPNYTSFLSFDAGMSNSSKPTGDTTNKGGKRKGKSFCFHLASLKSRPACMHDQSKLLTQQS